MKYYKTLPRNVRSLIERAKPFYPCASGIAYAEKYINIPIKEFIAQLKDYQPSYYHWCSCRGILGLYRVNPLIEPGTKVKILRKAKSGEKGWDNIWVDEMDVYVGEVHECNSRDRPHGVSIRTSDHIIFSVPSFVLEIVKD